jgi:hypothetical protein
MKKLLGVFEAEHVEKEGWGGGRDEGTEGEMKRYENEN